MTRTIRKVVVVVLILVGAGVAAAATAPVIVGPPVDIMSPISPLTQVAPSTGTTATTSGGVTTTTVGDTTTVTGTGGLITGTNPLTGGTTTPTTTTTPGTIERIVALTRTVEAGAPVSAFVVPATSSLVVTDVVITNPGTTPACGASVTAAGATATGTDLATTGVLCIPAQTSLTLALTTGLEFTSGRTVVLGNQAAGGNGALLYHLRGFLISGA